MLISFETDNYTVLNEIRHYAHYALYENIYSSKISKRHTKRYSYLNDKVKDMYSKCDAVSCKIKALHIYSFDNTV